MGLKICLTFALAFGNERTVSARSSKMILENIPYRQAVQRSMIFLNCWFKCKVRNEKRTVNFRLKYIYSGQYKQFGYLMPFGIADIIYNEEFDPGSGWTLATGLTHASRGVSKSLLGETTGARVSNAYPTCPSYWDSLPKGRLIPNNISELHDIDMKDPSMKDGDAFH